jgi:hypothetical protein
MSILCVRCRRGTLLSPPFPPHARLATPLGKPTRQCAAACWGRAATIGPDVRAPALPAARKRDQLIIAALVLVGSLALAWGANEARMEQYGVLMGCWPDVWRDGDRTLLTRLYWAEETRVLGLHPVREFFYLRVEHSLHFYLIGLASLVGWSGSVFRRVVMSEIGEAAQRPVPSWIFFVATFMLTLIGASVLYMMLLSTEHDRTADWTNCISKRTAMRFVLGGLLCGLFVVAFFNWLEKAAPGFWKKFGGSTP